MIEARRDKLECRRFPAEESRNFFRRLPRRALTVAGPEPSTGRVPDAVASPFLKTIWRDLCDLIKKPALHQNAKVLLKMFLFAAAFRVAEPAEQCKAIEHDRRVGGEHHIRQARTAGHDLKPCPGTDERCCERLEAAPSRSPVTYRIFRPGTGLHPRVDRIDHLEMGGIGQQQQCFRRHGGLSPKRSPAPRELTMARPTAKEKLALLTKRVTDKTDRHGNLAYCREDEWTTQIGGLSRFFATMPACRWQPWPIA